MRRASPVLADIYPEGTSTCVACGTTNLAGEVFRYMAFKGDHCPDCKKIIDDKEKLTQLESYQSGEEEPSHTDEITCPWCGHEQSDSWEVSDSSDDEECGNCDKRYSYERHVEVTYCSSRVEESEES